MDTSLSSSRPKHQRNCVAITEIIQFPHKHSKSSDIRILEQFKYRCQEQKNLERKFEYKKKWSFGWRASRQLLEPIWEILVIDYHDIRRREFRQIQTITSWWRNPLACRHWNKNIHTRLISKQHSRPGLIRTKGVFASVNVPRIA